jgi:hypothetical protein
MQVLFKKEFRKMFARMSPLEQKRAAPFIQQVWDDLKNISGPNVFQNLPYQIAMESTHKLAIHLKSLNIQLDPDEVIFSLVGSGFVILFSINLKHLSILEIWSIKPTI